MPGTVATNAASPDFYETRLCEESALATLVRSAGIPADTRPDNGAQALVQNGADGPTPLAVADYEGTVASGAPRNELQGSPHRSSILSRRGVAVRTRRLGRHRAGLIAHCERLRFRFAVIDCDHGERRVGADPRATIQDTQYAAFYYPWIVIADTETGARRTVPPGGHVLGVYARTDGERGVFRAPANETLRGVLELEFDINDATQGVLNPRGDNVIRRVPGRGIRVWGARTLTSNARWKYVNVRRLCLFLERSIDEGTQWVVFEPNDSKLWARVTAAISLFMRDQWRLGALLGNTEEKAYFVKCDRSTMTQDDIDNGRLVCEIGVALVRPAEFVVFRILQNTGKA
jgi:phage tail sheath protein FI